MNERNNLLIATPIFIWGFLTENEISGVMMGLTIMILANIKLRWNIFDHQYQRAADLTSIVFVIISIYMFVWHGHEAIYKILQATPFIGFPLILLQQAGTEEDFPLSAFQYKLRRQSDSFERVSITAHYFFCTLLAIATVTESAGLSLFFIIFLFSYYLWSTKAPNSSAILFYCLGTIGLLISLLFINSFLPAYNGILNELSNRITIKPWKNSNPNGFITSIGAISQKKQSDRIRVRVKAKILANGGPSIYLTQSLFDEYFLTGKWSSNSENYEQLDKISDSNRWITTPRSPKKQHAESTLEITLKTDKDLFLMATPSHTVTITSNDLVELSKNGHDNFRGEAQPGYVKYSALSQKPDEMSFYPRDLSLPKPYVKLLGSIIENLGINDELSPEEKILRIKTFLLQNFRYHYPTGARPGVPNTVSNFLLNSRKGHCEHFATVATLLLRQLGIPTRYAVGYLVSEWSQLESHYIARDRHAHAWTMAYIRGEWKTLDFTPPIWQIKETEYLQNTRYFRDLVAYLTYRIGTISSADIEYYKSLLLLLVPALLGFLIFRLLRSPQAIHSGALKNNMKPPKPAIKELISNLEQCGIERSKHETLAMLLKKSSSIGVPKELIEELTSSYYHFRFSVRDYESNETDLLLTIAKFKQFLKG